MRAQPPPSRAERTSSYAAGRTRNAAWRSRADVGESTTDTYTGNPHMFGAKISSVLASGILLLGSGAIAMAQAGSPQDLPEEANQAQNEVETLELENETATRAVEEGGLGEEGTDEGDGGTAFSEWVDSLPAEGCERGLTIAANAQNGATTFTSEDAVEAPSDHPAFTEGNCTEGDEGTERGEGESETFGRDTAGENSGGRSETGSDVEEDAGPPAEAGPPADAGPPAEAGPPADASPPADSGAPDDAGPPNSR